MSLVHLGSVVFGDFSLYLCILSNYYFWWADSVEDSHREERALKTELLKQGFKDAQISAVWCINVGLCKSCICYGKSVHLSLTLRYCVKTRERRGMLSSPSGSAVSLDFFRQESLVGDDPVQLKFEWKEVDTLLYAFAS